MMLDKKLPKGENIDAATVYSFGEEWTEYDQISLDPRDLNDFFGRYFHIFPWENLPRDAEGFDAGCGSGRWARLVAPNVGALNCVDPSEKALDIARSALADHNNVVFHLASVDAIPLEKGSQDFGFSLGVLHHVPDTRSAVVSCAELLKPGAPLLLYLYYKLDHRPKWFRAVWRASELLRHRISAMSPRPKRLATDTIAFLVYWPLARLAWVLENIGFKPTFLPLSFYRNATFYSMRTDSRDRFGTPLEHRFTKAEITEMMTAAGLENIRFSDREPYWVAVGTRRNY